VTESDPAENTVRGGVENMRQKSTASRQCNEVPGNRTCAGGVTRHTEKVGGEIRGNGRGPYREPGQP